MRAHRGLYALTGINLVLLAVVLAQQVGAAHAQAQPGVLRGRALQIVDDQGRIRASISVLPPGKSADGVEHSEIVLLRLITEQGRPTVKISSSEPSTGLSFAGPTGTQNAYLILKTEGEHSSLRLRNEDGREQIVKP